MPVVALPIAPDTPTNLVTTVEPCESLGGLDLIIWVDGSRPSLALPHAVNDVREACKAAAKLLGISPLCGCATCST